MKPANNILIFTQWSFKDALVQTYTLPYLNIIRKIIAPDRKIFLVTSEQENIALNDSEVNQLNKEWEKRNMQLLPESYQRFGLKKLFSATSNFYRLIGIIRKES
jgi:hypothetical protein